jgi:hypothetical protein
MLVRRIVFGVTIFVAATILGEARGGIFETLDKSIHDATGLPTPHHPKIELPNPTEALKSNADLAASIAAATGCAKCATDISNLGASGKKLISDAVNSYGFFIAPPGDLGGQLLLRVLTKENEDTSVQVETANPSEPTKSTPIWDIVAECLVQREGSRIDAYSSVEFASLSQIKDGDLKATASKECPEYNIGQSKSITSVEMLMAGASVNPRAKEGTLKYVIVGKAR